MNKTIKKTVDEKLIVLNVQHRDLISRQTALSAELATVNKDLAQGPG